MKCLVTGGCGFIGSHLVNRLIRDGHQVIILDDLSTGELANRNKTAKMVIGSVTDYLGLLTVMQGVDVVFHLAALPRVQQSVDDPLGTHEVNVTGTLNVFRAAQKAGVQRMIYSSSSSVYGDQGTHQMSELMTPVPLSPYGLQKWMGELYADVFADLYDLNVISLRYFNVYGPGQPSEGAYALVIPKFLHMKAEGKPLTIYGDGDQTRDYVHVFDVVEANILAATKGYAFTDHVILNIGTGVETSVNQIANTIGGPIEHIIPNPRGEFEERRKVANWSKAKTVLGWEPKIKFEDGLRELICDRFDPQGTQDVPNAIST